ncbi:hypothetical protein HS088_TW04G00771 [Tripterygium wilfordii]|uniref:DUF538 family protein n=1 Tax=Tripterygium wilfordii TaxID=458696 RepID=A0A7J7DR61_TRIWF|nr:uncharacterized protein LOC119996153 [Tripterygium wilfordii]KAF5748811.1 hypothetical protein HS088_TW04G00771 [Tripterygium wilfordii]
MARLLLSLIFLSLTHLSFSTPFNPNHPISPLFAVNDVHDLLPQYGFPRGLIPANAKSYTLEDDTGSFTIHLEAPCYVQFDQLVWYDKIIKGRLTYGAVHDVSGIQAKKLFLWLPVTGIEVDKDAGMLEFYVGALSEKLPAKQFQEVPTCRGKGSLRTNLASI